MKNRLIIDQVGYRYTIEADEHRIRFQRLDMNVDAIVDLTRVQAAVLQACLERADRNSAGHFPVETIGDLVISLNHEPAMITVIQGTAHIEIHPPGWVPIASEIAVLLPRMLQNNDTISEHSGNVLPGTMH